MYRPTVRMDDCFKDWIEEVVKVTGLDRNQIIRLALFSAPFSALFLDQVNNRRKADVTLPSPTWNKDSGRGPWRSSEWKKEKKEVGVSGESRVCKGDKSVERTVYQSKTNPNPTPPPPLTQTRRQGGGGIRIHIGQVSSKQK